jgi:ribulose-phosphate 3-epimerase
MQIIPAILTSDKYEAGELLDQINKTNKFSRVQVDFIDGEYAANRTVMPDEIYIMPHLKMDFDAHLMVVEKNLEKWKKMTDDAGFDRIICQAESIANPAGCKGLAIDIHSPVAMIQPYLPKLEIVVVMAVEPGFGGQEFQPEAISKVKRLVELRRLMKYEYKICVDGGVEKEMLEELEKAGADEVAVGAKRVLSW